MESGSFAYLKIWNAIEAENATVSNGRYFQILLIIIRDNNYLIIRDSHLLSAASVGPDRSRQYIPPSAPEVLGVDWRSLAQSRDRQGAVAGECTSWVRIITAAPSKATPRIWRTPPRHQRSPLECRSGAARIPPVIRRALRTKPAPYEFRLRPAEPCSCVWFCSPASGQCKLRNESAWRR